MREAQVNQIFVGLIKRDPAIILLENPKPPPKRSQGVVRKRFEEARIKTLAHYQRLLDYAVGCFGVAAVLRRQNTGVKQEGARYIQFGIIGQADYTGWVIRQTQKRRAAQGLEVELKGSDGKQSPAQQEWQALCDQAGVIYLHSSDPHELWNALRKEMGL